MVPVRQASTRLLSRRFGKTLLAIIAVAASLVACTDDSDDATTALNGFLEQWRTGSVPGNDEHYQRVVSSLGTSTPELSGGAAAVDGDRASAPVKVTWALGSGARWQYETTVWLSRSGDAWRVDWSPSTVHPELADGRRLVLRRGEDQRAAIQAGDGNAITEARPVVVVGVQPGKVSSAETLAQQLGAALAPDGADTSGLPQQISAAKPDAFVPVITLRKERYLEVRPAIYDLPGTVFREESRVLAPTKEFARALLGTVGPVTKEQLDRSSGRLHPGDQVGQGGLQARYDEQLSGTPELTVSVVEEAAAPGTAGKEVFRASAKPGTPLQTTLDSRVQRAADAAVAVGTQKTAVVAVRISDGAVLAVANSPSAGANNIAMEAQVPPGSTFKVVSSLSLLDSGAVDLDQPVPCPVTANVEGRNFKNSWNGGLDNATFRTAFANSCNTAFVELAPKLGADGLTRTADTVGVGQQWDLGASVYTGSVPAGGRPVDQAAASFGQGKTLVSPMVMAGIVAAVAHGQWRQPTLVVDPKPAGRAPDGPRLNEQSVAKLRTVMREVVTSGSAKALRAVRGEPLYGKTGTAEYGADTPPRSHSWFAGWQADIAFAVFVEDGGNEASLALEASRRFLTGLGG